MSRFLTAYQHN